MFDEIWVWCDKEGLVGFRDGVRGKVPGVEFGVRVKTCGFEAE